MQLKKQFQFNSFVILAVLGYSLNQTVSAKPLCASHEEIVFSCDISGSSKSVSICISPDLSPDKGYMYYAYGTKRKIDMKYPKQRQHPAQLFNMGYLSYGGNTGGNYISFLKNNGVKQTVYSISGAYGLEKQGVLTSIQGQNRATSQKVCRQKTVVKQEKAGDKLRELKLVGDEAIIANGLPKLPVIQKRK